MEAVDVYQTSANEDLLNIIKKMMYQTPTDEPFYVADLEDVVKKYRLWTNSLPRVQPYYAVKTNPNVVILRLMQSLGSRFDCASKEEIDMAFTAGAKSSDIIYAHPFKSCSYLQYAQSRGVDLLTFDSEGELAKIKEIYPTAKLVIRFRVPNVVADIPLNDKFGCEFQECNHLLKIAKQLGLNVVGTCFHVGGLCKDIYAYSRAIKMARDIFDIAEELGFRFTLLDLGGGYPGDANCYKTFPKMCKYINQALKDYFPEDKKVKIIAEPGCFFACSTFTLCTTVIGKKKFRTKMNKTVKEKMVYYLNDGTYGSFAEMYECYGVNMTPLLSSAELHHRPQFPSKLWGSTCCSLDCICEECVLPEMEVGEQIIFQNMGAYTLALASNFNGFHKPTVRYFYRTDKKIDTLKPRIQDSILYSIKICDWNLFVDARLNVCDEEDDSNSDLFRFG